MFSLHRKHQQYTLVTMVFIIMLAFGLRLYRLDYQSLWYDELGIYYKVIYFFKNSPPSELQVLANDPNMIVTSLIAMPWVLLIPNAFGFRWPFVLAGTLAIAVMYKVATTLHKPQTGLLAALFLSIAPVHIYHSQEAHNYAFVLLASLLSLWLMLLVEKQVRWAAWLYPVTVTLTVALHVLTILWLGIQSIWLELRSKVRKNSAWYAWPLAQIGMLIVLNFLIRSGSYDSHVQWIPVPAPSELPLFISSVIGLRINLWGMVHTNWIYPIGAVVIILISLGLYQTGKGNATAFEYSERHTALLLLLFSIIPPLLAYILSHIWIPVWLHRYLIPSQVTFLLLIAFCAITIRPRFVGSLLAALTISGSLIGTLNYYYNPYIHHRDWDSIADYISQHQEENDIVIVSPHYQAISLGYYLQSNEIELYGVELEQDTHYILQPMQDALTHDGRIWLTWYQDRAQIDQWLINNQLDAEVVDYVDLYQLRLFLIQHVSTTK